MPIKSTPITKLVEVSFLVRDVHNDFMVSSSLSEKAEGKRQKGPCEAQWDADYGKT